MMVVFVPAGIRGPPRTNPGCFARTRVGLGVFVGLFATSQFGLRPLRTGVFLCAKTAHCCPLLVFVFFRPGCGLTWVGESSILLKVCSGKVSIRCSWPLKAPVSAYLVLSEGEMLCFCLVFLPTLKRGNSGWVPLCLGAWFEARPWDFMYVVLGSICYRVP